MKKQNWVMIIFGLCATTCLPAYVGATGHPPHPQCNHNLEETGAEFVTIDSGAGNLRCNKIFGPFGKMDQVSVNKHCDNNGCKVDATNASNPFDAVVIGTNGRSCVYTFKDALKAEYLKGSHNRFRFACSDGGVTEPDLPDEPITSLEGGCSADTGDFSLIQQAVADSNSIDWVFGVGGTDAENDKTGLCVKGDEIDISRCDEQCIVPVQEDYDPNCSEGMKPDGSFPLSCRPCALTEEVPPPDGSKSYCWERSHQRAAIVEGEIEFNDFFIPVKTKSTGSLRYSSFEGSTCYQVTTTYRGRVYSYWTPSGCP
ncbi:MAG: hypothetical protein GY701_04790 [Sulfitobacter sp.]|nr:hypothetical protein [Sulfitobacter sp.]